MSETSNPTTPPTIQDSQRLDHLSQLLQACPHTRLTFDEGAEDDGRKPWVLETSGCDTVELEAASLRELLDLSIHYEAQEKAYREHTAEQADANSY